MAMPAMAAAMPADCPMNSAGEPAAAKCCGDVLCQARAEVVTLAVVNPVRTAIHVAAVTTPEAAGLVEIAGRCAPPGRSGSAPLSRRILFQIFRI